MIKTIKRENLYKYFFYFFVFSIPFQTRKVFLTDFSFVTGDFTEYGTIFLYLSDVLLLLSFAFAILFNQKLIKSALSELKSKSGDKEINKIFRALSILIIWFFVSALVNQSYLNISLFRSFKMAEMVLLVFFVFATMRDKLFFMSSLFIIILSIYFQSLLAIYQFLYQKNLFYSPLMHKLTGETILAPDLPGIAKIGEEGEKLIRAYGTLPHPNLLGGLLVFSLFISLYLYIEHKDSLLSSDSLRFKAYNKVFQKYFKSVFWFLIFTVQFIALVLSFSRSAWLGLAIGLIVFTISTFSRVKIVSRETIKTNLLHRYKELTISILLLTFLIIGNFNLISNRFFQDVSNQDATDLQSVNLPTNNTFADRIFFNNVSRETISRTPLFGSGPGTSIFQIEPFLDKADKNQQIAPWQYQPPHNIYSLSTSEIGIIGFIILISIIITSIKYAIKKIVSRETIPNEKIFKACILSILVGFIFIGFFDHYLWTLQQGQIIFWITIGLLLI